MRKLQRLIGLTLNDNVHRRQLIISTYLDGYVITYSRRVLFSFKIFRIQSTIFLALVFKADLKNWKHREQ